MAAPTDFEQLMMEYINRARLDPQGEFDRLIFNTAPVQGAQANITSSVNYFNVDLTVLASQFAALTSVAPLAWNSSLGDSAKTHSQVMIDYDIQSHQVTAAGEAALGGRASAAGYTGWNYLAENIFAYTEDPLHGHAGFFIDWGNTATGIQSPPGHRDAIMSSSVTEIGIGVIADNNPSTGVGPYVVTQDFGRAGSKAFVTGVVYADADSNYFYSIGEGTTGVQISSSASTTTGSSGGYTLNLSGAEHDVTFSGAGISAKTVTVSLASGNVKLDLVDANLILSSANITLGAGATDVTLLGDQAISATGNASANILTGNRGSNSLAGGAGNDTLNGGSEDASVIDALYGGTGNDTYYVNSLSTALDIVYEGGAFPGGAGDVDTIISTGAYFWDYYDVGEILTISGLAPANAQMVSGRYDSTLYGSDLDNILLSYGGTNEINPGKGLDTIGLGLYDLDASFNGVNTVVLNPGDDTNYIYDFQSGIDIVDTSGYSRFTSGAEMLANVADTAWGSYVWMGLHEGQNEYVAFVGLSQADLVATDFFV